MRNMNAAKLSVTVTAVCTAALCASVCVSTLWQNRETLFDFDGDTVLSKAILEKEQLGEAFGEKIAGFDTFLSLYGTAQRAAGVSVYEDAGYQYIIRDSAGFQHYHITRQDAEPMADAVTALYGAMRDADIPFLYVQAPTKEIRGFTVYPAGISCVSYENSENLMALLDERNVPAFSFRTWFAENGTDPASLFYYTDHHWTTETAFAAFGETVRLLNERYGWQLDETKTDAENWKTEFFPACFLGSMGRRVGEVLSGLDDYTFFEPKFDTAYDVYLPPFETNGADGTDGADAPRWTGTFREALVRENVLYSDDHEANRYASYFQYDYGELVIVNRNADNDLRIALIKDSFSLPLAAFLSTVVKEIDMIDCRDFEGDLVSHLLDSRPDLVITEYSNSAFGSASDFIAQLDSAAAAAEDS